VQMWNRPHNKGLTMSKMPPMATSGKIANASTLKHARQVLESKQRQRDRRELLSSIGKNSAPAIVAPTLTPSRRNERYAARVASAKKHRSVHLSAADLAILMMDKIDKLNEELALLKNEKRVSNPIVGRVLEHAARSMGMMVVPNPAATVAMVMSVNLKSPNKDL